MDHVDSVTASMSSADISGEIKGKICNGEDHLLGLNKVTALGLKRYSEKMGTTIKCQTKDLSSSVCCTQCQPIEQSWGKV